jgi:hypothetical protein
VLKQDLSNIKNQQESINQKIEKIKNQQESINQKIEKIKNQQESINQKIEKIENQSKIIGGEIALIALEIKNIQKLVLEEKMTQEFAIPLLSFHVDQTKSLRQQEESLRQQEESLRQQEESLRQQEVLYKTKIREYQTILISSIFHFFFLLVRSQYLSSYESWKSKVAPPMAKRVTILQDFESYRTKQNYYVDKSQFIRPLLMMKRVVFRRPRRFGKSLTLSMLKYFFYGLTGLFKGLHVDKEDFEVGVFRWCPADPTKHNFPPCPVISLNFKTCDTVEKFNQEL